MVFFVAGLPKGKGSFRVFRSKTGKPIVAKDSAKTYSWERAVADAAQNAMTDVSYPSTADPWPLAVKVSLVFWMPRPKAHFRKNGKLRDDAPRLVAKAPDIDKLCRAALDPMIGICFRDDSQVVSLQASKWYANNARIGMDVEVTPI